MCLVARQDQACRREILPMVKSPRNAARRSQSKDYTAVRYVGRHSYQAGKVAAGFDGMPNCAITSALTRDELDCRASQADHLWNQYRRVSLSSRLLKNLVNPAICGPLPCQAQSLRPACGQRTMLLPRPAPRRRLRPLRRRTHSHIGCKRSAACAPKPNGGRHFCHPKIRSSNPCRRRARPNGIAPM